MRFALPDAPLARLVPALTAPAGLRRWWDPDAGFVGARLAPGVDGPTLAVRGDAGGVILWEGEAVRARFDLAARVVGVEAEGLDAAAVADLAAGWELAVAALAWSLAHDGAVRWLRIDVPVALAYEDAWSRLVGPQGLASRGIGETGAVRLGDTVHEARVVVARPPRAVALVLPGLQDALVRVQIGPGESVNAARLELLTVAEGPLPGDWEPWFARRLGMTWVSQLAAEG